MGRTGNVKRVRNVCMLIKYKEQKVLKDTVVGLRVGRPENSGSIRGRSERLSSPRAKNVSGDSSSLLSNGYRRPLPLA